MIRRLRKPWPARRSAADQQPVRLLAVSDERDPALDHERNRRQLGHVDGIVGCGDLEPDYLSFLADAFRAPLVYVRGNHDRGANWNALAPALPDPLEADAADLAGVRVLGLSWPGSMRWRAARDEGAAWQQALGATLRTLLRPPLIVFSHVPPRGLGDTPEDHYHRGFAGYRWLCRRLKPTLWLHGHTSTAAALDWKIDWGSTTLVNVTGAVLIELGRADQAIRADGRTAPAGAVDRPSAAGRGRQRDAAEPAVTAPRGRGIDRP